MEQFTLQTRTWGDNSKRALVLHGLSSNSAGWWRLGPDLADLGYTVIAPDLRSHGDSPKSGDLSIPAYTGDVIALGTGWDLVFAHSLGGTVALACFAQDAGFAKALILEDPAIRLEDNPIIRAWLLDVFDRPLTKEQLALDNPRWHMDDARTKAEALRQSGPEAVIDTLGAPTWDGTSVLASLSVQTLLLGADPALGALVSAEVGRDAAAANSRIRYEMIANGSHSMHRDEYGLLWGAVREWLATASAV